VSPQRTLEQPPTVTVRARRPVLPRAPRSLAHCVTASAPRPVADRYLPPPVPTPPTPRPQPRLAFRADVEGLRGVAVLLVVLYHAGLPWTPGGFVGVDVFFVVSGYVITSLLVAEVRQEAGVSLCGFYARRCRRVLPAAGFVLVASCALGAVLLPPLARLGLARDAVAAALYGANWHFVAEQTDYLRAGGDPSPLLHFWSLGVEEQFYLVWPAVFVAAIALAGRLRLARTTVLAVALSGLTAASFALSLHWTATSAPTAYLSSPTRAWQFAVGAWLALLLPVAARVGGAVAAGVRVLLGVVGAGALGWAATTVDVRGYPGTAALVPTLATAALLAAGCDLPRRRGLGVTWLLGTAPLRQLGALSFTWYLWHWPLVVLVTARWGDVGWPMRLGVVLAALLPAALTSRWVERPLRRSAVVSSRPRVGLALGVAATVLPLCAAVLLAAGSSAALDPARYGSAVDGRIDPQLVHLDDTLTSGPVAPAVRVAALDVPPSPAGCHLRAVEEASPACVTGTVGAAGPVVLFGDSHAEQWLSAAQALARELGTGVVQLTKQGCPATMLHVDLPAGGGPYPACDRWRETSLRRLEAGHRPAVVVVTSYSGYAGDPTAQAAGWLPTLRRLVALGAPVVYLADTPLPPTDVPDCVSGALDDWDRCAFDRATAVQEDRTAAAVAAGRVRGVWLVDLTPSLCPDAGPRARCPAVRGGVLLYRDASHLTDTAVRVLAPQFVAAVRDRIG
jgi:peptidoglycan/LPS O-acetylase OafA/YrhL